jgi:hypothetical protein
MQTVVNTLFVMNSSLVSDQQEQQQTMGQNRPSPPGKSCSSLAALERWALEAALWMVWVDRYCRNRLRQPAPAAEVPISFS